jgi:hypothetical protein
MILCTIACIFSFILIKKEISAMIDYLNIKSIEKNNKDVYIIYYGFFCCGSGALGLTLFSFLLFLFIKFIEGKK